VQRSSTKRDHKKNIIANFILKQKDFKNQEKQNIIEYENKYAVQKSIPNLYTFSNRKSGRSEIKNQRKLGEKYVIKRIINRFKMSAEKIDPLRKKLEKIQTYPFHRFL